MFPLEGHTSVFHSQTSAFTKLTLSCENTDGNMWQMIDRKQVQEHPRSTPSALPVEAATQGKAPSEGRASPT
jgi:hypothetical protein